MFGIFKKNIIYKKGVKNLAKIFARKDNWHRMDLSNGNLGYGWLHYALICNLRPKKVLCIGSRYGLIPAVCALACKDSVSGSVDFVDAGFDMNDFSGPGRHWGGVGFWKSCNPKRYFGRFGLGKHINLYVMTSDEFASKFARNRYDYIYIDGDHSYDGVKKDFDLFWPRLNKKGFLAIHDIGSPDKDGNIYGTRKFWKELKLNFKNCLEFCEDPGVGIVQKS